jgi:hypothetical protein
VEWAGDRFWREGVRYRRVPVTATEGFGWEINGLKHWKRGPGTVETWDRNRDSYYFLYYPEFVITHYLRSRLL